MSKTSSSETGRIKELFKEYNIQEVIFRFTCGGDSMGDTDFEYVPDTIPDEVKKDLEDYFQNEVYNHVEFYVNSDGHYEGEVGTVTITLDIEDEDADFEYVKDSESEYRESVVNVVDFEISPEEETFIQDNVTNINGGDGQIVINYKRDFIMSDAEDELQVSLKSRLEDFVRDYCPDNMEEGGELDETASFTTNDDGNLEVLQVGEEILKIFIDNRYTIYKKED